MSEWSYIVAAYTVTWLAILGYTIRLALRLRRAATELTNVSSATTETES